MSYLDHDLGPDTNRSPERPIQRKQASSPVLDLQRLAGNAAVSQAIQRGQFGSSIAVQREEESDEESEAESEVDEEIAQDEEMAEEESEEG